MLTLNLYSEKIGGCANNQENSSTTKIGQHIPCGYSMSTIWVFNHIENTHKICTSLRECGFLKRKKMLMLTKEELKSHQDEKACYICGKKNLKTSQKV